MNINDCLFITLFLEQIGRANESGERRWGEIAFLPACIDCATITNEERMKETRRHLHFPHILLKYLISLFPNNCERMWLICYYVDHSGRGDA